MARIRMSLGPGSLTSSLTRQQFASAALDFALFGGYPSGVNCFLLRFCNMKELGPTGNTKPQTIPNPTKMTGKNLRQVAVNRPKKLPSIHNLQSKSHRSPNSPMPLTLDRVTPSKRCFKKKKKKKRCFVPLTR